MLKFSITAKNPYSKDVHCNIWECYKPVSKNKGFEAEYYYSNYNLFHFLVDLSWRGEDHAGPEFEVSLLGYSIRFKIYDYRHWDYAMGNWANFKNKE